MTCGAPCCRAFQAIFNCSPALCRLAARNDFFGFHDKNFDDLNDDVKWRILHFEKVFVRTQKGEIRPMITDSSADCLVSNSAYSDLFECSFAYCDI